jgi:GntR family transcriptional regulator, transcriptional repressor for pyruvate dehydrogenase complex
MERIGLVSRMEQELERMISLGQLPPGGDMPSEQTLARRYGVSRTTTRAAMMRLACRGLVVQHPGRKTRAVPLEEAVTLETLGVALQGEQWADPARLRLLEGFLELKRDTALEVLAACCQQASEAELAPLSQACFALAESTRWEQRHRWVEREFSLLRQAALVANRPGHFLLLQSLERAFRGMEEWLLPHLDAQALCRWAQCALHALEEADEQRLRTELGPLLVACDEHLLASLAPAPERTATPEVGTTLVEPPGEEGSPQQPPAEPLPGAALQHLETAKPPEEQSPAHERQKQSLPGAALPNLEASEPPDDNNPRPAPLQQYLPGGASHTPHAAQQPGEEKSAPGAPEETPPGATRPIRYHCHTGWCLSPPTGCPVPETFAPGSQQIPGGGTPSGPPFRMPVGRQQPPAPCSLRVSLASPVSPETAE